MKKITTIILSIFLLAFPAKADEGGIKFVQELANNIIDNVLTANISEDEKLKIFQDRFKKDLDTKTIGRQVASDYWKKASKEDQDAFLEAFLDFTTKSWADKFNLYTGQKINFTGIRPAKSNQFFVISEVQNNPPVEVLWRVKKVGATYKITDIVIEGVSMIASYRNEYRSFLHQNGGKLSTLTSELKTRSSTFKFTKKAQ
ncbi:MAG: ABC transporter substrate-binding protein [Alphaproteobacteria bacterium]|nr:ABC transporter substrate-binding protein [Alphaproteobacteria bacterium]